MLPVPQGTYQDEYYYERDNDSYYGKCKGTPCTKGQQTKTRAGAMEKSDDSTVCYSKDASNAEDISAASAPTGARGKSGLASAAAACGCAVAAVLVATAAWVSVAWL